MFNIKEYERFMVTGLIHKLVILCQILKIITKLRDIGLRINLAKLNLLIKTRFSINFL